MDQVDIMTRSTAAHQGVGGSAGPGMAPGDERVAARMLADVAAYVPTLRKRALDTEKLGRIPDDTIRDLDSMGVFKACTPVEYGGHALTPLQLHAIIAEIARGCGSTGWVTWVSLTATQWGGVYDRQFQDELFSSDWTGPMAGGAGSPCVARRVPGGIMLKGTWPFSSGCQHVAFVHVGAICPEDQDPEPLLVHVPREEFTILDDWKVMGMRGTSSNTMVLDEEVFVPDHRIRTVRDVFAGNRPGPAPDGLLFQTNVVTLTASLHSAVSIGIARAAFELFKEKIFTRKITHTHYARQSDAPITHVQLGELHCKLLAAELVSRNNVIRAEKKAADGEAVDELEIKQTSLENAYVIKACSEIAELILRASGASSIRDSSPFQRLFRESLVATMHARTLIETCMEDFGRATVGIGTSTGI